ncbi:MAG: DUF4416 family protein, partial [Nanoarchaeota archaeon]|nr:DUF4416 family protein [Nanoarchaeota archaeon]
MLLFYMANLFIAVMYCDGELLDKVKEKLIEMYGEIKKQSKAYDFDKFTSYY